MMRTSLRTCWRTVGHDDLDLRLRRALAHGSFDTSSIFHQLGWETRGPPLPTATQSSVPCALLRYPRESQDLSRSQDPLPTGCLSSIFFWTNYFEL